MPKAAFLSVGFAIAVACGFTFLDYALLNDVIPNRGPELNFYGVAKTLVAVLVAVVLVMGIYLAGRRDPEGGKTIEIAPVPVVLSLALSAAFVLLFLWSPQAFNRLGSEDALIENLAATFAIAGAVGFGSAALAARRLPKDAPHRQLIQLFAWLCAGAMFLLCMEEISWGQRILNFGTPDSFSANLQGEVNIHNFYTTPVHTIYRLGSWTVLMFLPFIYTFGPRLAILEKFDIFVPPAWVAAMSVPVACFNYNAWPFFPTQVVVFSSFMMMVLFWRNARHDNQGSAVLFAAAGVFILIAQAAFIIWGQGFVRLWDVTEYQEFFMALGLATVGWVVRQRVMARTRTMLQPEMGKIW